MLLVREIKENFGRYVLGLSKRGVLDPDEQLRHIIDLDDQRKEVQGTLDDVLSRSNQLSKKIGTLMQSGHKVEAQKIKLETAEIKERGNALFEQLQDIKKRLKEKLYE